MPSTPESEETRVTDAEVEVAAKAMGDACECRAEARAALEAAAALHPPREGAGRNHWNEGGDLVIEQKTLCRQVGWRGQSGRFYPLEPPPHSGQPQPEASFAPIYEHIATWVEGEGWDD